MAGPTAPVLPDRPSLPLGPSVPTPVTKISERLFLGCLGDALDAETLRQHNITAVLSILLKRPAIPHLSGVSHERQPGLNNMHIRLGDHQYEDILCQLSDACSFIDKCLDDTAQDPTAGAVLVHCRKGVSRSAAIVTAYLMKKHAWDFESAAREVVAKRWIANPQHKFGTQLELWYLMKYELWEGVGVCGNRLPKLLYRNFLGGNRCCVRPVCYLVETQRQELEWWEEPLDHQPNTSENDQVAEDDHFTGKAVEQNVDGEQKGAEKEDELLLCECGNDDDMNEISTKTENPEGQCLSACW